MSATHSCLIRFAPIFTGDRHNDPRWNREGRTLYERLRTVPGAKKTPLLVNHDQTREIGTVKSLMRLEDVDGPWWFADAELTTVPEWLRRGARASFEFVTLHRRDSSFWGPAENIADALVKEVSVLSPATKPAEPLAQVMVVSPLDPVPPKTSSVAGRVSTPARLAAGSVAARPAKRRTSDGVSLPASDRYLSNAELATLIEVAKTADVEMLARIMLDSGELSMPDPYLGAKPYWKAA